MEIFIDLEKNYSACPFDKNSIHELELERVKGIIDSLKKLPDTKERLHNTITISGTRGSGKTSFLLTLLNDEEVKKDCEVLEIIDPTLVEEKGHIFLSIVSYIRERVEQKIGSPDFQDSNACESWKEALRSLARGLPVLNGVESGNDLSDWNDPVFVMEEGLRRVEGANHLEKNFHKYIEESLKILGKKFFIIAFDDVDTDFSRGTPVLEMMRKYLTTSQVIPLLSGDLNLYSLLIRKKQWENFGKSLLKNEYDSVAYIDEFKSERYTDLVSQLESQYTLKILKPEFRITLSTIGEKVEAKKMEVKVQIGERKEELKNFYNQNVFSYWGIKEKGILNLYWHFFSTLPIRSQLSLLKAYKGDKPDDEELIQNITDVFYSELKTKNIDVWDLARGYGVTTIHILRFLTQSRILEEGSQLYPRTNDPVINAVLVALGVVLGIRMKNKPEMLFDFIIRICNVVDKVDKWGLSRSDRRQTDEPNIEAFIDFSKCFYDYGLRKISSIQCAYSASFGKNVNTFNEGMIPLARLQRIDKQRKDENNLRFDEVFNLEDKQSWKDYIAFIPLLAAQDKFGRSQLYFSFYNLLAAIGDLLSVPKEDYGTQLAILSQLRYFPMQSNSNLGIEGGEVDADETNIENSTEKTKVLPCLENFVELLKGWIDLFPKTVFSPYLVARTMIRMNYSLSNIKHSKYISVAHLFHKYVICFLNAVLVEEMLEKNRGAEFILSNPTDKDHVFVENIKRLRKMLTPETDSDNFILQDKQRDEVPVFNFFIRCPLLTTFINAEGELKGELEKWAYQEEWSIFNELAKVHILGNKIEEVRQALLIIEKQNRTVCNTDDDARMIAMVLEKNKKKLNYDNVKHVIRSYFANKRVYNSRIEQLIERINVGGYMNEN